MSVAWRDADEALLVRLADEEVFERFWSAVADGAPAPHPRAAGLIAELRASDEGRAAIATAEAGDFGALVRLTAKPSPAILTPRLAHHLALYHSRLADELERADDPARSGSAEWPRLRGIAMWLWLAEEGAYLDAMAHTVAAGGLSADEARRAAAEAPYAVIARLGDRARAGARELSEPARIALRVLERIGEACALSGVGERVQKQAERRAARARSTAIDDAIGRVDHALEEARGRDASTDELVALFADGAAVWRWSDRDEHVERFLVERITPFCWARYRERRWNELRSLLRPIHDAVDHLAGRIERDKTQLAYAAPCAQMFVFRAEVAQTFDAQLTMAERAVSLCTTHRNGRLVLADLLVERSMRILDAAMPWNTGDALSKAATDVRRAAELYPELKRLADAKQRMKAMGRDVDAA